MGCRKRNSILWFDDNFVGTELDPELSYAKVQCLWFKRCNSKNYGRNNKGYKTIL